MDAHRDEILEDCLETLDECTDDELADSVALTRRSADAFAAGHVEAAMALATCLAEPLAEWASKPRVKAFDSVEARDARKQHQDDWRNRYKLAAEERDAVGDDFAEPWNFQYQVLIAPIPRFFTRWFPNSGKPPPEQLSRHVVAHRPTVQHLSESNALLALMLVTGILRAQQNWADEVGNQ